MSEDKVRYFQGVLSGHLYEGDDIEGRLVREVQVVPLDAIVIPRDELPEVSRGERMLRLNGTTPVPYTTADQHRSDALTHLALAEYLREHPPVDEAQVGALDSLIGELGQEYGYGDPSLARRLVERGVRVEKA